MPDTGIVEQQPEVVIPSPFIESNWSNEPTIPEVVATDPVIEEKDKKIEIEHPTSDKPDEPEKIPAATPKPIQDRPDEVKKDVKPPAAIAPEPIKFANEESEKVFNLLKDGKHNEVREILNEQNKLDTVDKLSPAEIIKLNLQYQNKGFTPTEINDLFDDSYSLPDKPIQGISEDDDEFKLREEKYQKDVQRVENRIARDAKPAIAELQKLQKEIILPDIQKDAIVPNEPTQEELDAQKRSMELFFKDAEENTKLFNGYKTTFKDEEVTIEAAYKVTDEQKKSLSPLLESLSGDLPKFFNDIGWTTAEGKLTPKMIEDIHLIQNKDAVFSGLVQEVGTKRLAEQIKSQKNVDYSGNKGNGGDMGKTPVQVQKEMATHFFSQ